MNGDDYVELASGIVRQAMDAGATGAECTIREGSEFSASVRMREIETLKEAGSRAAGLRILKGRHTGSAYTSDLSQEGIRHMVRAALELADITSEDPHAGLPEEGELGAIPGDLQLFHADVESLPANVKIAMARRAEDAALSADARIHNSEGASFDTHQGRHVFANSLGFSGGYQSSYCSLSAVPVARQGNSMERDYWYTAARSFAGLEEPEAVGRMAAQRAVRRLGAVKAATQKAPVVFDPRTARSLLDNIFDAVHGGAIYRKESFLAGRLGERVASEKLTVIDDGTIPGLFGTSPFDDEGAPTRRTVVIEKGVLRSYLLNCYAARKLGLRTTGNASRTLAGNAGIGNGNLYIEKGTVSPAQLIAGIREGFYVTELMGFGVNIVTGDYSRGAAGLWIRDGELAFPVSEVTIAGKLQDMLMGMEAIASDLEFRGSMAAPTLLVAEMTIGGR